MEKVIIWLKGKKTYFVAGLVGIVQIGQYLGVPGFDTIDLRDPDVLAVIAAVFAVTLGAKINRISAP